MLTATLSAIAAVLGLSALVFAWTGTPAEDFFKVLAPVALMLPFVVLGVRAMKADKAEAAAEG